MDGLNIDNLVQHLSDDNILRPTFISTFKTEHPRRSELFTLGKVPSFSGEPLSKRVHQIPQRTHP